MLNVREFETYVVTAKGKEKALGVEIQVFNQREVWFMDPRMHADERREAVTNRVAELMKDIYAARNQVQSESKKTSGPDLKPVV